MISDEKDYKYCEICEVILKDNILGSNIGEDNEDICYICEDRINDLKKVAETLKNKISKMKNNKQKFLKDIEDVLLLLKKSNDKDAIDEIEYQLDMLDAEIEELKRIEIRKNFKKWVIKKLDNEILKGESQETQDVFLCEFVKELQELNGVLLMEDIKKKDKLLTGV